MMNDERSEEYATKEGGGVLVVSSGDATPLLETPEPRSTALRSR
jgi:hypothetical protein